MKTKGAASGKATYFRVNMKGMASRKAVYFQRLQEKQSVDGLSYKKNNIKKRP